MEKGSETKVEAAAVREIDFSKLVHEYVARREVRAPRDVRAAEAKRRVAA